ncbi:hypothetical protein Goarm_005797, partial [Gossypium armourianum]|nr:hypothetical protein [Gossypium armourianum]
MRSCIPLRNVGVSQGMRAECTYFEKSDHCPLLINTNGESIHKGNSKF